VRLIGWILLAVVAVTSGCGGNQPAASRVELPVLSVSPNPNVSFVGIIGDAYTSGLPSGGNSPSAWPALVAAQLKSQGVVIRPHVGATNGSGYGKHRGVGSATFFDLIRQAVAPNDKLVIVFGAHLDRTALPALADAMTAAVQRTLAKAKKAAPSARFLIIGPAWMDASPPPELLQLRDIVQSQAVAIGALFVDPIADGWFKDHPEAVGLNGDRPNEAGHVLLAQKIAPLVLQELQMRPNP
jgi:lysophospholipase L1-like esterase